MKQATAESLALQLLRRIPMPVLAILIGLLVGLLVWAGLDQIQGRAVTKIFSSELRTQLELRSRESLVRFDRYIGNFVATARLLANHRRLAEHLDTVDWLSEHRPPLRYHRETAPGWLPDYLDHADLPLPNHILLVDDAGVVREVYQHGERPLPPGLETEIREHFQGAVTAKTLFIGIGELPYLVVGDLVKDTRGFVMGSLAIALPIDSAFLAASQQGLWTERVAVALVDGARQRLVASIDPETLRPGSDIKTWREDYLVTTQALPRYEDSDWNLLFATFISHASVERMSRHVRSFEWRQRALAALAFILVFTLVIYLVSLRLNSVLKRMSRFAHRALDIEQPGFREGGNQLLLLEDWIRQFTQLVLRARQELKRRHEHEMRETLALKAAIMEAALDSIVTIDQRGRIVELNATAEKALGLRRRADIGKPFAERVLLPSQRGRFEALLAASRAAQCEGREPRAPSELDARRHDGASMTVEVSIVPIDVGEQALYTLYLRDITAVRRAEQEARQHQAELVHVCRLSTLGEVATGMAHELNQPLSAIVNYANGASRRLQGGQVDRGELVEVMGQITTQAERASEIIRRLRGLVAKQAPMRNAADLNQLVREVGSFIELDAARLGVRLDLKLAPGPVPVNVDLVQIEQVLLNLTRNALDALEAVGAAEPRLTMRTRMFGDEAEVQVIDNGPGIEPGQMRALFEPFFTTKASGMGMGLTISRTILDDHEGRVWAESEPGVATVFHVVLPLARPAAARGNSGVLG